MRDCPVCFIKLETGRTVCPKCESNLGLLMEMDRLPETFMNWAEKCREADEVEEARTWTALAQGLSHASVNEPETGSNESDGPEQDDSMDDPSELSGTESDLSSDEDIDSGGKPGFSRIVSHLQPVLKLGRKKKSTRKEDGHAGDGDH